MRTICFIFLLLTFHNTVFAAEGKINGKPFTAKIAYFFTEKHSPNSGYLNIVEKNRVPSCDTFMYDRSVTFYIPAPLGNLNQVTKPTDWPTFKYQFPQFNYMDNDGANLHNFHVKNKNIKLKIIDNSGRFYGAVTVPANNSSDQYYIDGEFEIFTCP